jgi:hypothetical protein
MEMIGRERRRFFERPAQPRPLRITGRDLALLGNLARFRLASSAQLAMLDGGSEQNVSRALLALWENRYVERPEVQVATRLLHKGSRPIIYGLTRKAARLLRDHGWTFGTGSSMALIKSAVQGGDSSNNTVAIGEFFVALDLAAKGRDNIRILERSEILEDAPKTKRERQLHLEASIRLGGVLKRNASVSGCAVRSANGRRSRALFYA